MKNNQQTLLLKPKRYPGKKKASQLHRSLEESLGVYFFRSLKKRLFHNPRRKPNSLKRQF